MVRRLAAAGLRRRSAQHTTGDQRRRGGAGASHLRTVLATRVAAAGGSRVGASWLDQQTLEDPRRQGGRRWTAGQDGPASSVDHSAVQRARQVQTRTADRKSVV